MPNGFPLFGDYGSEDPFYAGSRSSNNVKDITIMQPMAFHQWHPPFQYWMAKGRAPMLNKNAHSISNYMNDNSGHVPNGGTCEIWDGSSHEILSLEEIESQKSLDNYVRGSGCMIPF